MWGLWGLLILMAVLALSLYLTILVSMFIALRKKLNGIRTLEAINDNDDPASLLKELDGHVGTYITRTSPFTKECEFDPPSTENLGEYRDFFHYHFLTTLEERAEQQRKGGPVTWFSIALMAGVLIFTFTLWPVDLMSVFILLLPMTLLVVGTVAFVVLNPEIFTETTRTGQGDRREAANGELSLSKACGPGR